MSGRSIGALWSRYLRARERERGGIACPIERRKVQRELRCAKEKLVVNYSPLARYVASGVLARSVGTVEREDVVSWGLCGLLCAVETYDPARPAKFETYAISKIRWSILDELRKTDPLPRTARLRARKVELARGELAQRYGRAPTEAELVRQLGVSLADHRAFVDRMSRSRIGSLEARPGAGPAENGLHEFLADNLAADPGRAVESAETRAVLARAIGQLCEQQRTVTAFYYYEGLTLKEIGSFLGLTEGRISQILKAAILSLREALAETTRTPEHH